MANIIPTATLNDISDDRYNGVTITGHLTNGLTYSLTTTVANVTGAEVLTKTETGIAAVSGVMGPLSFTFTNGGSTVSFDGIAFTIGGTTIEAANNDVSGTLENGATITYDFSQPFTAT